MDKILHHFKTMGDHVCWYLQGNHHSRVSERWCRISSIHRSVHSTGKLFRLLWQIRKRTAQFLLPWFPSSCSLSQLSTSKLLSFGHESKSKSYPLVNIPIPTQTELKWVVHLPQTGIPKRFDHHVAICRAGINSGPKYGSGAGSGAARHGGQVLPAGFEGGKEALCKEFLDFSQTFGVPETTHTKGTHPIFSGLQPMFKGIVRVQVGKFGGEKTGLGAFLGQSTLSVRN